MRTRLEYIIKQEKCAFFSQLDDLIKAHPFYVCCSIEKSVDIDDDGMKALVNLSFGDMRKALNIMQVGIFSISVTKDTK